MQQRSRQHRAQQREAAAESGVTIRRKTTKRSASSSSLGGGSGGSSPATPSSARRRGVKRSDSVGDEESKKRGLFFDHRFTEARLGISLALVQYGDGRRCVGVESTESKMERVKPTDELVAINGVPLTEPDEDTFRSVVDTLTSPRRPLTLTFLQGHRRCEAFAEQHERSKMYKDDRNALNLPPKKTEDRALDASLRSPRRRDHDDHHHLQGDDDGTPDVPPSPPRRDYHVRPTGPPPPPPLPLPRAGNQQQQERRPAAEGPPALPREAAAAAAAEQGQRTDEPPPLPPPLPPKGTPLPPPPQDGLAHRKDPLARALVDGATTPRGADVVTRDFRDVRLSVKRAFVAEIVTDDVGFTLGIATYADTKREHFVVEDSLFKDDDDPSSSSSSSSAAGKKPRAGDELLFFYEGQVLLVPTEPVLANIRAMLACAPRPLVLTFLRPRPSSGENDDQTNGPAAQSPRNRNSGLPKLETIDEETEGLAFTSPIRWSCPAIMEEIPLLPGFLDDQRPPPAERQRPDETTEPTRLGAPPDGAETHLPLPKGAADDDDDDDDDERKEEASSSSSSSSSSEKKEEASSSTSSERKTPSFSSSSSPAVSSPSEKKKKKSHQQPPKSPHHHHPPPKKSLHEDHPQAQQQHHEHHEKRRSWEAVEGSQLVGKRLSEFKSRLSEHESQQRSEDAFWTAVREKRGSESTGFESGLKYMAGVPKTTSQEADVGRHTKPVGLVPTMPATPVKEQIKAFASLGETTTAPATFGRGLARPRLDARALSAGALITHARDRRRPSADTLTYSTDDDDDDDDKSRKDDIVTPQQRAPATVVTPEKSAPHTPPSPPREEQTPKEDHQHQPQDHRGEAAAEEHAARASSAVPETTPEGPAADDDSDDEPVAVAQHQYATVATVIAEPPPWATEVELLTVPPEDKAPPARLHRTDDEPPPRRRSSVEEEYGHAFRHDVYARYIENKDSWLLHVFDCTTCCQPNF